MHRQGLSVAVYSFMTRTGVERKFDPKSSFLLICETVRARGTEVVRKYLQKVMSCVIMNA